MLRFRATSALPLRSTVATLSGSCCSNSTVTHSTLLASSASSVPSCRSLHTTAHTRTTAAIPHRGTWLQHSSVATSSVRGFSTAAAAATATAASTAEEDADTSSIAAAVGRRPPGTTLPAACLLTEAEQRHAIAFGPTRNIRNFSIIAHIDHGKSTLADRLLESAGNIRPLAKQDAQVLDNLQVERERGITVKAVTATMFYRCPITKEEYVLNLIDTPGHVDFSYEVSRSLAACEGALLLVDASQGIQAQTLANFYTALEADLDIIPVISKVDLPHADVAGVKEQITTAFGMDADSALLISSKTGIGIDAVFDAIVKRIKPPQSPAVAAAEKAAATTAATAASAYSSSSSSSSSSSTALTRPFPSAVLDPLSIPLRAFVFDSWYSSHRGVICLVKVVDGAVRRNDRIAPWHGDASTAATTTTATGATATATNASSLSPSSSSPSAGGGGAIYDVQELGLLLGTSMREVEVLRAGQVGYLIGGIKTTGEVRLGETFFKVGVRKGAKHAQNVDTFVSAAAAATGANNKGATAASASSSSSPSSSSASSPPHRSLSPDALASAHVAPSRAAIEPLPGFKPARSMVFAGLFPGGDSDFAALESSLQRLLLTDASVRIEKENSVALGLGFRCGFLGVLHMDVFSTRLQQDYGTSVILTAPTVPYEAVYKEEHGGATVSIRSPAQFPEAKDEFRVDRYLEPIVRATIISPVEHMGALVDLCNSSRGEMEDLTHLSPTRISLRYKLPLSEIVVDFYDKIKSLSSGYASFDYEEAGAVEADICRLEIRLNGEPVDALSCITHRSKAEQKAKKLVAKLKEKVDRQQFEIIIQAAIGSKILCRERVAPYRKDVLNKSGKTVSDGRGKKLLDRQKAGKKRLKAFGNVELSDDVFKEVMKLKEE